MNKPNVSAEQPVRVWRKLVAPAVVSLSMFAAACGSSSSGAGTESSSGGPSGAAGEGMGGASAGNGGANNVAGAGGGAVAGAGGRSVGGAGGQTQGGAGGQSSAGAGGQSNAGAGGQSSAGAGGQPVNPACVKPSGTDVTAQGYTLSGAVGCFFSPTYGAASITISDEATFQQVFHCPNASSGIDFSTQRLEAAVFSSATPVARTWAVETTDAIHLGFTPVPSCGGTAPPSQSSLILLPASAKPVVLDLCTSGCNYGNGGAPA
jgi:hypothetical protein